MIRGLLFDLDGTMILSDPLHVAVFADLFAERGRRIDAGFFRDRIQGRLNADIFAEFFPDEDGAALADLKEARFRDRLGTSAAPVRGLPALLDEAAEAGLALAVVTNAPARNADAMLSAMGLADRFDAVVIGDALPRGKPDPLPYVTGLERLGLAPEEALAFEDSVSGVTAATRAGIATVGIRSSLDDAALRAAGAVASIHDYTDPGFAPWRARIQQETA